VRARRVSEAAETLAQGAPDILAAALEPVMDLTKHSRAFRQILGPTPEQLRAQAFLMKLKLQQRIRMEQNTEVRLAPPRLSGPGPHSSPDIRSTIHAGRLPESPPSGSALRRISATFPARSERAVYGVIWSRRGMRLRLHCGAETIDSASDPPELTGSGFPQTYAIYSTTRRNPAATFRAIWKQGRTNAGHEASTGAPVLAASKSECGSAPEWLSDAARLGLRSAGVGNTSV
jgi:AraC family transcriptional regulator